MLTTFLYHEVVEREMDYEVGIPGSSPGSTIICGPVHLSGS